MAYYIGTALCPSAFFVFASMHFSHVEVKKKLFWECVRDWALVKRVANKSVSAHQSGGGLTANQTFRSPRLMAKGESHFNRILSIPATAMGAPQQQQLLLPPTYISITAMSQNRRRPSLKSRPRTQSSASSPKPSSHRRLNKSSRLALRRSERDKYTLIRWERAHTAARYTTLHYGDDRCSKTTSTCMHLCAVPLSRPRSLGVYICTCILLFTLTSILHLN